MPKTQKSRQPGDPVRVNLSGDVADHVASAASQLGISFSSYVQLRLQGQLPSQTNLVPFELSRQESVSQNPGRPLMALPEPSQATHDEPKIQSIADLPSV